MIKKTLRNAIAGTATVGAMMVPTAMTVAPQIDNMACQYPDSIVTQTSLQMQKTYYKGSKGFAVVTVVSDAKIPRGEVKFRIPGTGFEKTKALNNEGQRRFRVPVGRLDVGKYEGHAKFFGNCRFKNSSDVANFSVARKP